MFTLGDEIISQTSILQKCVAQFTTTTTYVSAIIATKYAIWLDKLIIYMRFKQKVLNFHYDNHSVLNLAANQMIDNKMYIQLLLITVNFH